MLQTLTTRLLIAAATFALGSATASAAVVTQTFTINSAIVADIFSATFDGALTPCSPGPPPDAVECAFFGGFAPQPPAYLTNRNILVTPTGTGDGTLTVDWETTTGEIMKVREMYIRLPDMVLLISQGGVTTVTITQGNSVPVASPGDVPFLEAGVGTLGRDLDGAGFFTQLGIGTPDTDQLASTPTVFHHSDPTLPAPIVDTPDFAVFNDVVDSCVGVPATCGTIFAYLITLDAVRYRLEGSISGAGGNSLVLKGQTANFSLYRVNFTTAATGDADTDTIADTVDNCPDVANTDQADNDTDGRGNMCDNCRDRANSTAIGAQCDSDGDGFGNRCDGDITPGAGNGFTNSADTTIFKGQLGAGSAPPAWNKADINCNGFINSSDTTLFKGLLGSGPGPGAGP